MALLLATLGGAGAAEQTAAVEATAAPAPDATAIRLPPSSAMPQGEWRLPPPGYLDYCLRYRGRDEGCRA